MLNCVSPAEKNASSPIVFTVEGIVISSKLQHPIKSLPEIFSSPAGRVISVSISQFSKAPKPIFFTLSDISIKVSSLFSKNAYEPISRTVSGTYISEALQSSKAPEAMTLTGRSSIYPGISTTFSSPT